MTKKVIYWISCRKNSDADNTIGRLNCFSSFYDRKNITSRKKHLTREKSCDILVKLSSLRAREKDNGAIY